MGQSAPDKLDVRLGGIYGLEQIARDSRDTRTRLATDEVLTAYVREHAVWNGNAAVAPESLKELQARAPDIQAVMTVLGRRDIAKDDPPIDLHGADLRGALLTSAHQVGAVLLDAQLSGVDLSGADLERANFARAHLEGAFLEEAHLERADLGGARLNGALLDGTYLDSAFLGFAHLERAKLSGANLQGAEANGYTSWPPGFDWKAAGVKQVR